MILLKLWFPLCLLIVSGKCSGYRYLGCFKDEANRALRYPPQKFGYSIDTCGNACKDYNYFALQANGWCSCENDYGHATKYGKLASTSCPSNRLGGLWANDLFQNLHSTCDYFNPSSVKLGENNRITTADIGYGEEMEISFDYILRSSGTTNQWYNIFHIGNVDTERLPAIYIFGGVNEFHIAFSDKTTWNNAFNVNYGALNVKHHIYIKKNRRQRIVVIDGHTVYADNGNFDIDLKYNLYPLYLSNPFYPSADATLSNICVKSSFQQQVAVKYAPILRFDTDSAPHGYPMSAQLFYDNLNSHNYIDNKGPLDIITSPTYYHIEDCGIDTLNIVYWWFYGNQNPCININVPDIPFFPYSGMTLIEQGNHIGDWEHIVVEINKQDVNKFRVEINQHGGAYSLLSSDNDLQLYDKTHSVIYVGQIAHGSYHNNCKIGGCGYFHDYRRASDLLLSSAANLISLNRYPQENWIADKNEDWGGMKKNVLQSSQENKICNFKACDDTGCHWNECDNDALLLVNPYCIGEPSINNILNGLSQTAIDGINVAIDAIDDTIVVTKDITSQILKEVVEQTENAAKNGAILVIDAILGGMMSVEDAVNYGFISSTEAVHSGLIDIINAISYNWISINDAISHGFISLHDAISNGYLTIYDAISKGLITVYDAVNTGYLTIFDAINRQLCSVYDAISWNQISVYLALNHGYLTIYDAINRNLITGLNAFLHGYVGIHDAVSRGWISAHDAVVNGWMSGSDAINYGFASVIDVFSWTGSCLGDWCDCVWCPDPCLGIFC